MLDPDGQPRCEVCALPLPRGAATGACSRRCAARRAESARTQANAPALEQRILAELRSLSAGSTMCPGALAHRVLPGIRDPLTILRPLLFDLQQQGRVSLSMKGAVLPWWKIRGPFRIRAR